MLASGRGAVAAVLHAGREAAAVLVVVEHEAAALMMHAHQEAGTDGQLQAGGHYKQRNRSVSLVTYCSLTSSLYGRSATSPWSLQAEVRASR